MKLNFNFDTNEQSPLYLGAMRYRDVKNGTNYVTYNCRRRGLGGVTDKVYTFQGLPFFDVKRPDSFTVMSTESEYGVYLFDRGIIPRVGSDTRWNETNFSVKVEEASIKKFHSWLLDDIGDTKSADALKARWPEWFPPVMFELFSFVVSAPNDRLRIEIAQLGDKIVLKVNGVIIEQR